MNSKGETGDFRYRNIDETVRGKFNWRGGSGIILSGGGHYLYWRGKKEKIGVPLCGQKGRRMSGRSPERPRYIGSHKNQTTEGLWGE